MNTRDFPGMFAPRYLELHDVAVKVAVATGVFRRLSRPEVETVSDVVEVALELRLQREDL